ncbi:TonB-linked outer membrane protein, SusC/RagA family [Catalinimonas alkaloidigena]|uniref:TonB-linked outer membrane protein, SusC/RagA family n=1 Tax=Catalinimonas alkaloidigena TaxID=1075417 RepID=A0A1G9LMT5_9BACT|nr:TonB-dependent receptor [Catalinimonas alkaloidigena]SDL62805.1 TonB-linked outer membrane protein, SusC/RagA family [Catalinimonas alkaloidigena]
MQKHVRTQALFCLMWMLLIGVALPAFGQSATLQGTVIDDTGEGIPGVSVLAKGTSVGTITDVSGNYTLTIPNPQDAILVFSFVGYTTQEVPVGSQTTINVTLASDIKALEEVVVVGYGTQKKATLTGSIAEVEGKEIVKSPQPNLSNALAGRFSGIIANNRGGEPGYDGSSYTIRGLATTGNNDVLVVVDGVPGQIGGLERLNPNDIESITILKDASAAIYGSRAANGVILVTTKKGTAGKPVISYSFNQGFSSPTRLPKMADAATYAQIRNEIAYYNNPDGGMNQVYDENAIQQFASGADPLNYPNTNWQDATLKQVALQNQHNLSVNGGSENIRYFVSLGKLFQDGLYKNGATKYNQYSVRSNLDANITPNLNVGLSLSGRKEDRQYPIASAGDIFRSIYRAYPTVAAVYPNGLPSSGIENSNPVLLATDISGTNQNPRYVFNGILKASYTLPFVEGLSVDGFYSVDQLVNKTKAFSTPYVVYTYASGTGAYNPTIVGGSDQKATLSEEFNSQNQTVANIKLNFNRQLGSHNVNAFVGYEQSERRESTFGASRIHFPTTQTPELSQGGAAATDYDNWGSSYHYTRKSYISRIAYNFSEKYLAEVQMRVDGSSTFPKGKQYGFFPSVSAGWRISEESWFQNSLPFINNLKLRASYGQLGNDNVGLFQYYDNYQFANRYVIGSDVHTGIDLIKLGNPDITWEVAQKTDIGLNAVFLKNFTLELVYFQQKRSDILTTRNASIPGVSGIVNPYNDGSASYVPLVPSENIGKVNSNGVEATLGYQHTGPVSFGITANGTYAKSEIVFIDEAAGALDYQRQTGQPLNTYLLYRTIGIFRTEDDLSRYPHVPGAKVGDLIYEDYNGDGEINADDQVRSKYGNIPLLTYGLTLNAGWKNFDLSAVFAGQGMVSQYVLPESGTIGNYYSSWADNRWSPSNPDGTYPRVDERASSAVSGGLYQNDFWLNNASFLRLKTVQLGYNVPTTVLTPLKISSLRVYASAFNLFTITPVKDYDPEGNSTSGQFYPQQRILNLGVNVSF